MLRIEVGSMPMRVMMYFAANHDEELMSADVALKFGGEQSQISTRLRPLIEARYLEVVRTESSAHNGGCKFVYGAGPALLEAIGARG